MENEIDNGIHTELIPERNDFKMFKEFNGLNTYFNGDLAEYTGESFVEYGCRWFKIKLLEGYLKGKIKLVSKCPECGLKFGQDKPISCLTCEVKT